MKKEIQKGTKVWFIDNKNKRILVGVVQNTKITSAGLCFQITCCDETFWFMHNFVYTDKNACKQKYISMLEEDVIKENEKIKSLKETIKNIKLL